MPDSIYQAIIGTPWWVYILFVYLIFVGIKASRPGEVEIVKLAILPAIFTYLSLESLINQTSLSIFHIATWVVTILLGTWFGVFRTKKAGYSYDPTTGNIRTSGSWMTLIVVMIIFFSKYYFGYMIAVHPHILQNSAIFDLFYIGVSGLCTGQFIGVFIYSLSVWLKGKSQDLTK